MLSDKKGTAAERVDLDRDDGATAKESLFPHKDTIAAEGGVVDDNTAAGGSVEDIEQAVKSSKKKGGEEGKKKPTRMITLTKKQTIRLFPLTRYAYFRKHKTLWEGLKGNRAVEVDALEWQAMDNLDWNILELLLTNHCNWKEV